MRTKVTLMCDLDETPSLVIEALQRATEDLRALSNKKFNYWQVSEMLMQIDYVRRELESIDSRLCDATNVATGWLETMLEMANNPAQGESPDVQEEAPDEQEN